MSEFEPCTGAAEPLCLKNTLRYLPCTLLGEDAVQPCSVSARGFSPAITHAVLVVGEEEEDGLERCRRNGTRAISPAGCSSWGNKAEAG